MMAEAAAARADKTGRYVFAMAAVTAAASAAARVLLTRSGVLTTFIGIPLAVCSSLSCEMACR